jgi:type IV pilus assembly protein PilM
MERLQQYRTRPRLACEVTVGGVIAARAADKASRVELFTARRLQQGAIAPGLNAPNIHDAGALRTAIGGALESLTGKSRDVIAILPDSAIRVLLLEFETLPTKAAEVEPMVRFRLKKSLPFDVENAALSYDVRRDNDAVRVVAAVSPRSVIEEYEAAFRDAGYSPGMIVPSTLAALGLVEGRRPTLVLKVDPLNITIAAAQNQELRLIRTLENPYGSEVTAAELAEAVLPSVVFFEDTFGANIEDIFLSGVPAFDQVAPLLHEHTGAKVHELAPELSSDQNLSGESLDPGAMAGIVGALLG